RDGRAALRQRPLDLVFPGEIRESLLRAFLRFGDRDVDDPAYAGLGGRREQLPRVTNRLREREATVLETDPVRVVQRPRAREGADEMVGAIEPVRSDLHRAPEGMIPVRVTGERPDASAVAEQDARNVA